MKRRAMAILLMLSILTAAEQIEVEFPEEKLYIGDRIRMSYRIFTDDHAVLYPPDPAQYIHGLEIIEAALERIDAGKQPYWSYTLETAAFDTGFVLIPELPLIADYGEKTGTDTIYLPEKYVFIHSILDSTAAALPAKPPRPLSVMAWWEYLLALLLLSALAFFIRLALRSRRPDDADELQLWKNPAESAESALRELEEKAYLRSGEWKAFYLELTMICRRYYEGVLFIHLQELTTAELLPELKSRLPESRYSKLELFFRFADLVKFAKAEASEERGNDDIRMLRELIAEQEKESPVFQAEQIPAAERQVP